MPQPATEQAGRIADLYRIFLAGGVVVALLVWGLATFAVLRYRRRGDDMSLPSQTPGSVRLEAIWTGIPLIAVLVLFGLTYLTIDAVNARAPETGVELHVLAFRWGWRFEYPADGVTITSAPGLTPQVMVPVGQPVHVTLDAADVIHAFFVPAFLFKRDAIPGRESTFDFLVQQAGTYPGACAEFCGVFHDQMPFTIRAVSVPEFETWLAGQGGSPAPAAGSPTPPGVSPAPAAGRPDAAGRRPDAVTGASEPIGVALPAPAFARRTTLTDWLTTTDHKRIGILYLVSSFGFFVIGGLFAEVMRTELAQPGLQVVSAETYDELFTMHGTIMLLFFATPAAVGFANFLVPLQIGAADMSFRASTHCRTGSSCSAAC